ncbi:tripartite tricarboxylate transporter TctB family protein [Pseudaminobacter sp. 19-2017]|uniref:Tripartite tricarboxylate transporter TctB family protein n=1 Tax=Pseudaminobacter soli (ex Zhang et al. 2022) TaxID=2831468 RepID=A0A942IAY0_9HYPH|nr:tripartite tricarboxylate transporter TctB family protein [Pseudaminobacter soli]MBS3651755.1 tripartite tricarboxylate transporter TctB family protein [Pseudaminobacter soli]
MVIRRFHMELFVAGLTALAGAVTTFGSLELGVGWTESGPEPGYFPFYIGLLLAVLGLYNGAHAAIAKRGDAELFVEKRHAIRLARFGGPMAAFVVVTILLGLYVGTALYLFYVAWRQGGYRPLLSALIGVGFSLALFAVFELTFKVPLLKGPLEPLFGIY